MSFRDFHGNAGVVTRLREAIGRERFPQAAIFAGPEGAGKYTLALMCAKALNCLDPKIARPEGGGLPDYCGRCDICVRLGQLDDLAARFNEAVEARAAMRDPDKKDTRIRL